MYVYQIRPDGCYVVFDLDTEELIGEECGTYIPFESGFDSQRAALIAGDEIEPVISNDSYGWLLTVYKPISDSSGKCVAYVAVDISMEDVMTDRYIFAIKMIALLFGVSVIMITAALWLVEERMVKPINAMTDTTKLFAYNSTEGRRGMIKSLGEINIRSGDEIESLYDALVKIFTDVDLYIDRIDDEAKLISKLQNSVIMSFANMVENRDGNTGEHIRHTANYVGIIARGLRDAGLYTDILTDSYIDNLITSAPLHDIGKIKIPDSILLKPGRLTPDEFRVMETHSEAGADILRGAADIVGESGQYLSMAIEMAGGHHERFDGTGYPAGLYGDKIPLSARIMAVADVFDALISKRCYKEAEPFDKALLIMQSESGTHFDPDIVETLIRCKEQIRQAAENK